MLNPSKLLHLVLILLISFAGIGHTITTVNISIDTQKRYQVIDGFGISEAFQRAKQIQLLSPESQKKALDLLFSTENGAGLSILRNGIGSSPSYELDWMKSIEPTSPGSSNATPAYHWDGDDAGQAFVTKEAKKRGVEVFYANAWSAPGFMKTNADDSNGGYICGVSGANCTTGDWRHAYAEYLIQNIRFYKEKEGINITHLGFLNEPDLNQTYASMQSSGFQAAEFMQVLKPVLDKSEFRDSVKIVCCEATGWGDGEDMLSELQTIDGAENTFDVYSAHGYSVHPSLPFATGKKIWQTEWADLDGRWNIAWDNLGKEGEGISWANKIHSGLTLSNISALFYWIGAEETPVNSALVRLANGTVTASARLWAFAHYSRTVRPEAIRVDAKSDTAYVKVSAFENKDGKIAVHVINNGHVNVHIRVDLSGVKGVRSKAMPWVTSSSVSFAQKSEIVIQTGSLNRVGFEADVGARSIASFVL